MSSKAFFTYGKNLEWCSKELKNYLFFRHLISFQIPGKKERSTRPTTPISTPISGSTPSTPISGSTPSTPISTPISGSTPSTPISNSTLSKMISTHTVTITKSNLTSPKQISVTSPIIITSPHTSLKHTSSSSSSKPTSSSTLMTKHKSFNTQFFSDNTLSYTSPSIKQDIEPHDQPTLSSNTKEVDSIWKNAGISLFIVFVILLFINIFCIAFFVRKRIKLKPIKRSQKQSLPSAMQLRQSNEARIYIPQSSAQFELQENVMDNIGSSPHTIRSESFNSFDSDLHYEPIVKQNDLYLEPSTSRV